MNIVEAIEIDMPRVRELFREYQLWLGIDLCFQGFEQELEFLPGSYAPPKGAIFLAVENRELVGCVGIRPRMENEAELKRLYVRSNNRGHGIGKQLFLTAMSRTKKIGYASIVLDTLPKMLVAKSLYVAYGFRQSPAYYKNPEEDVEYYRYEFG